MSRKHIETCYLRDVLLRGTIVLKMYQTTVGRWFGERGFEGWEVF